MNTILRYLPIIIIFICPQTVQSYETYIISETGIDGLIEVGMTLDELKTQKIEFNEINREHIISKTKLYKALSSSIEFEIINNKISQIWFYANKNISFKILLQYDKENININFLHASEITRNFGEVKRYFGPKGPTWFGEPLWVKNISNDGSITNIIFYPYFPLTFSLKYNDFVKYISVKAME